MIKQDASQLPSGQVTMLMNKSENGDIQRQIDLGDATEGTQIRAQQGPQAFGGVDVHATTGILASAVIDGAVAETGIGQEVVDTVRVGVDGSAVLQARQQPGAKSLLLQIAADTDAQLTLALHDSGYGWFVPFPTAASPLLQATSACGTVGGDATRTALPTTDDVYSARA